MGPILFPVDSLTFGMSTFTDGIDDGNIAFGVDAGEEFTVVRGGNPGTYMAISIDSLEAGMSVAPGGFRGDTKTLIFIRDTVFAASGLSDGAVLIVRGERGRIASIAKDGDNTLVMSIESAGAKLS